MPSEKHEIEKHLSTQRHLVSYKEMKSSCSHVSNNKILNLLGNDDDVENVQIQSPPILKIDPNSEEKSEKRTPLRRKKNKPEKKETPEILTILNRMKAKRSKREQNDKKMEDLKSNCSNIEKTKVENKPNFEAIKPNFESKEPKRDEEVEKNSEIKDKVKVKAISNESNVKDKITLFNENAKGGQLLLKPKISNKTPVKRVKKKKVVNSANKSRKITNYYQIKPSSNIIVLDQPENDSKSSVISTTSDDQNLENQIENSCVVGPKSDVSDHSMKKSAILTENLGLILPENPANPPSERSETGFAQLEQPIVGLPNPGITDAQEKVSFASIFTMKKKSFVGKGIQDRIMKLTRNTSRIEDDRLRVQTPGKRKFQETSNYENEKKLKVGSPDYTKNQPD